MKITILGSGTAAPRKHRNMAGYLLEVGGSKILIDSGAGTIRQLTNKNISLLDIHHILYTHFHNDHINDLPAILWSNNYGDLRKKTLTLHGPKGLKKYASLVKKVLGPYKLKFPLKTVEHKPKTIFLIKLKNKTSLKVEVLKSKHTPHSVSYKFTYKGKSLVYTGDTDYHKGLVDFAENVDVLIVECSTPDNQKIDGHLTPSLCGKIATESGVKKLVLTHFYPKCDRVDVRKQCRKTYAGKLVLAKDFLTITV